MIPKQVVNLIFFFLNLINNHQWLSFSLVKLRVLELLLAGGLAPGPLNAVKLLK